MAPAYHLVLSDHQRRELEAARRTHPKAYVREKAAAILKVADGQAIRQVALSGLWRQRHPETVRDWIADYQRQGLAGLQGSSRLRLAGTTVNATPCTVVEGTARVSVLKE